MAKSRRQRNQDDWTVEELLDELDDEQLDIWEHSFQEEPFVRAYKWAKRKGNGPKGCLVYADSHDADFENTDHPVVKRDDSEGPAAPPASAQELEAKDAEIAELKAKLEEAQGGQTEE